MEYFLHSLENGIRLVHLPQKSHVAHLGFIVHTGSRDEKEGEHGMAHFIEHAIFKGTKKRKAFHILSRLENVGGEINAYTTKEETCIFAAFMKTDYQRATELIFDICFNPIFPEKEINREKNVIIDEILSYYDNPSELIFDEFEELVFKDHPIGRSILGNENDLNAFTQADIHNFMRENYATNEMVICSVGEIQFEKLIRIVSKYFGSVPKRTRQRSRKTPVSYFPEKKEVIKNTHQVHCVLGNRAYSYHETGRTGLHLLNNILGGPGMNSRLNLSLREKNGFSYSVESHYIPYTDSGLLNIYFGCEKEKYYKCLKLVYKEIEKLCTDRLGVVQLDKAKKQLIGQRAISAENNEHLMLALGKSILIFNKFENLEEVRKKIESVTSSDILHIANEVFNKDKLSVLTFS